MRKSRENGLFLDIPAEQWNDWHWQVENRIETLEELKKQNIWTYASDMNGESLYNVNFSGGCALVIGAEGQGVSRLVRETCDTVVSIPMKGHIDSLNASVAAGILMAEVARHRG
mgnify:CR=1 FL=1